MPSPYARCAIGPLSCGAVARTRAIFAATVPVRCPRAAVALSAPSPGRTGPYLWVEQNVSGRGSDLARTPNAFPPWSGRHRDGATLRRKKTRPTSDRVNMCTLYVMQPELTTNRQDACAPTNRPGGSARRWDSATDRNGTSRPAAFTTNAHRPLPTGCPVGLPQWRWAAG